MNSRSSSICTAALVFFLAGCSASTNHSPDGGAEDSGPVDSGEVVEPPGPPERVDLLFILDNSHDMAEELDHFASQVPLLLRELLQPEDRGADTPNPVTDLHVGIVNTDIEIDGPVIMPCTMNGEGGELINESRFEDCQPEYWSAECGEGECPWLSHTPDFPDLGDDSSNPPIWQDFSCIGYLGISGCGFEQPLEASLLALTTQSEPGAWNEGFLRDDSLLVVVFFTSEDDCSAEDVELFNTARDDLGPVNVRCIVNDEMLFPVERYDSMLRRLRPDPNRLLVVVIGGIPIDGSWNPGETIEELEELSGPDPDAPNTPLTTCSTGSGLAMAPVRLATLAYGFGENGLVGSICRDDYTATLQEIAAAIQLLMIPTE